MQLPNYFFADLPDNSSLTHALVLEGCRTLKRNRERFLADRSTESLIQILASLARDWLDPEFQFRKMALENAAEKTGFNEKSIAAGLDNFFRQVTRENLERLVIQDLGSLRRLDEFSTDEVELKEDRASMAHGPDLIVHFTGGVLPNPVLTSIMLGLLARSAQFVKCARGTSFLPRMFAHSLYIVQPKLGACLEIAEWPGGTSLLEQPLFEEAGCVTATGSDETLERIHKQTRANTRFLGYGHKLSFAYIAREQLSRLSLEPVVQDAAEDVVAWNQLGCLSPHLIFVETGGPIPPRQFAEMLAAELAGREASHPRGDVPEQDAAAIASRRMFYEVRASVSEETKIWKSEGSTAWTVVYEDDPQFQLSCLNRFIFVKAVADLENALAASAAVQGKVSSVGLGAPMSRVTELANRLAKWGVARVCPIGKMQQPPLTWRHDGRPSLADLVTWTDLEMK